VDVQQCESILQINVFIQVSWNFKSDYEFKNKNWMDCIIPIQPPKLKVLWWKYLEVGNYWCKILKGEGCKVHNGYGCKVLEGNICNVDMHINGYMVHLQPCLGINWSIDWFKLMVQIC
jgi:hypothetical protein